jgi:hypothetical protein
MHRPLPERVKRWYKSKPSIQTPQFPPSNVKKDMIKRKTNVPAQIKLSYSKTKPALPSTSPSTGRTKDISARITRKNKDQLPTITTIISSKQNSERKGSLVKSRPKTQPVVREEKKHTKVLDDAKKTGDVSSDKKAMEKLKTSSRISIVSKAKDKQKNMLNAPRNLPAISSSTTIATDVFSIDNVPKIQMAREGSNYCNMLR